MNALLLGAGGLLGGALLKQKPSDVALVAFTRAELDVRDSDALQRAITGCSPDWIINASGLTNVDAAEQDPDLAFAVNADAVGVMARLSRTAKCGLLHFSTDYVFDGRKGDLYTEADEPHPVNVYGESKLAGERLVASSGALYLVVRTQWLYGEAGARSSGKSFVQWLWDRALEGVPTRVVADQTGCCTYNVDLARSCWDAMGRLSQGTYHIVNRGRVSRFDIAKRVFRAAGVADIVSPCRGDEIPGRAPRPMNSALDVARFEAAMDRVLPDWTDALDRYLRVKQGTPKLGVTR
jgi:dTDP-4-dehydrorhamnose reductase